MDIKEKIEKIVDKVKKDPAMLKKFQSNPVGVVEDLLGVDLPNDIVEKIVDGVKAKISLDKASDDLGALGGLFGKK